MTADATTRFRILGPMLVEGNGGAIDVGGPKQRAVLALLLINANRPLTADQLSDHLWGEHPPSTALATLQSYISNLRRLLEPARPARSQGTILVKNAGGYQLSVTDEDLDAACFEAMLREATGIIDTDARQAREILLEALSLWRGPALADFRYDEFARAEAARLEDMRITALELRIAAELTLGGSADLVPELEDLVAAHPLRERLWGHLMLALYRSGRQAEALRAYRRCSDILGEIGIVPGEELRQLELAILNQDPLLISAPDPTGPAVPPYASSEIVGRANELRSFDAAIERARSGRGSILVLEGEPGVGKTKLLETFQQQAAATGCRTAFARCVEVGGTPPFWPWLQLSRQLGTECLESAAGRYAPYLAPLLPHGDPTTTGSPLFRVAEGLAVALTAMAATTPIALVIDDAYSADPDSLSLLALLAAELESMPVVIAVSHRAGDVATAAFRSSLTEMMRLDWVRRIHVPRLDAAAVSELVAQLGSDDIDEATARAIFRRTEGNAFFTIELTKLLLAEHASRREVAASAVPATVLEVLGRRLSRLSREALHLVRVAAVCGRTFELAVACEAAELDLAQGVAGIEEAVDVGLVTEARKPGSYRFSHIIVVDTVTHALGGMRRAQLHERIAAALETRYGGDPDRWVEIAHHRTEAVPIAGPILAIAALARAGSHAMASNAFHLAHGLLEQRLRLVLTEPHTPKRDGAEIEALLALAPVWTWLEGYSSPQLRTGAHRLWELTGLTSGSARLDTAHPIASTDPILASIQARFSVDIVSGDMAAAEEVAQLLLELSEQHPDPMVVYSANQTAITVWTHSGRIAEAVAAGKAAAAALDVLDPGHTNELMLPLGQQPARITHYAFSGRALWLAGDSDRAVEEFMAGRALCDRLGNPFVTAFATTAEGFVAAIAGDLDWLTDVLDWGGSQPGTELFGPIEQWRALQTAWRDGMLGLDPAATQRMREAFNALDKLGAHVATTGYWALLGQLEQRVAGPDAALDALDRGVAWAYSSGEMFWYPELERLRVSALDQLGRSREARTARERARAAADELGVVPVQRRLANTERPG